ncbi:hydrogenase large subunit [Desulfonauticus submarinus]|uniref:Hydrogenase large subunit n=2 Tax=Desulfonauticus submarinus TaxID=206665 RepID=A0A1H0EZT9_9BACT|nr:hydrogenase large subunit [Desulfonauticus submarinus]
MAGCKPKQAPAAAVAPGKKIKVAVDPVTRIEGHLKVEVEVKDGKVVDAHCFGGMFRGFENILVGRDPRDASQLTQRICGVCPTAHATASVRALDDAFNVKLTTNGRIARNLILGANYLQSHILHFYHLAALDYVKGPDVAPFIPRYSNPDLRLDPKTNQVGVDQYLKALEIRRICHEMVALLGGKMPHVQGMVVGGTTEIPTADKIVGYLWRFKKVKEFIENEYLPLIYQLAGAYPDLLETGKGWKNVISYGVFPLNDEETEFLLKPGVFTDGKDYSLDTKKIKEYVRYSWFDDADTGLHPSQGRTNPKPGKKGAYSFIKAPRYNNKPHEAGPLARMWVTNPELSPVAQKAGFKRMRDLGEKAFSILGRHVARAEEAYRVAKAIEKWLTEIKPGAETYVKAPVPKEGEGLGLTEAPRGSLLHYVKIKDSVIENYQVVAATIWNASPRDDMGQRGPIEQALIGVPVPDPKNPVNVGRLIRSFDP